MQKYLVTMALSLSRIVVRKKSMEETAVDCFCRSSKDRYQQWTNRQTLKEIVVKQLKTIGVVVKLGLVENMNRNFVFSFGISIYLN